MKVEIYYTRFPERCIKKFTDITIRDPSFFVNTQEFFMKITLTGFFINSSISECYYR